MAEISLVLVSTCILQYARTNYRSHRSRFKGVRSGRKKRHEAITVSFLRPLSVSMPRKPRRSRTYSIRISRFKSPYFATKATYFDWLSRGFIREKKHKNAVLVPGYVAWLEDGQPRIKHLWTIIGPYIRTNSRIFEMLALYAIWTPCLTPLEMQWEIQSSYNTDLRWNTLTVGADLGRTVF